MFILLNNIHFFHYFQYSVLEKWPNRSNTEEWPNIGGISSLSVVLLRLFDN